MFSSSELPRANKTKQSKSFLQLLDMFIIWFLTDVFQALLFVLPQMEATHSFESLNEEEAVAIAGSSREQKPFSIGEGSVLASPSPTKSLPSAADQSPEISSFFDDMALNDVRLIIHHPNI